MDIKTHEDMNTAVKELNAFSSAFKTLSEKVNWYRAQIVDWQNQTASAEAEAKRIREQIVELKAKHDEMRSDMNLQMAPIRRKTEEDARRVSELLLDAEKKHREAEEKLAKATALLSAAEEKAPALTGAKRGR